MRRVIFMPYGVDGRTFEKEKKSQRDSRRDDFMVHISLIHILFMRL